MNRFPRVMINLATSERPTIQLRPRTGPTVADVETFLADRRAEAQRIDPTNWEVFNCHTEVLDVYGLFDIPDPWSCIGSEWFVRHLPDGDWVWSGDLPKETIKALMGRPEDDPFSHWV